jgi:hypothetical protein
MTAVEWLYEQIIVRRNGIDNSIPLTELFEQASELFEQQINDAFNAGVNSEDYFYPNSMFTESETYYNETYKNETK